MVTMDSAILTKAIFQKQSLDDCSLEELQQAAQAHPYFMPVQLLLAEKLKQVDDNLFEHQKEKLFLYFDNPFWLDYLLNGYKNQSPMNVEEPAADAPGPPDQKPSIADSNEQVQEKLTFEPYYTVDYFASQGIKFVQEEKPADRLGQQLRSFTEWLKTMKKLPEAEIIKNADVSSEEKVVQLAGHSLDERDVETEAMAEVWIKQGNIEKAIDVYRKLSLLNPSKSAYFAAKIEQLKNN
jgi:hypothetical protein